MNSAARAGPYLVAAAAKGPVILTAEVSGLSADLGTIDWLARLVLLARRQGGRIAIRGASAELRELIDLAGLEDVLHTGPRV